MASGLKTGTLRVAVEAWCELRLVGPGRELAVPLVIAGDVDVDEVPYTAERDDRVVDGVLVRLALADVVVGITDQLDPGLTSARTGGRCRRGGRDGRRH